MDVALDTLCFRIFPWVADSQDPTIARPGRVDLWPEIICAGEELVIDRQSSSVIVNDNSEGFQ